jgi:hypothetical protein
MLTQSLKSFVQARENIPAVSQKAATLNKECENGGVASKALRKGSCSEAMVKKGSGAISSVHAPLRIKWRQCAGLVHRYTGALALSHGSTGL